MILVNGAATEVVAVTDRGFAYGDGVFRTFPARGGRARAWRLQYRKLAQDCTALGLPCPDEPLLAEEVMRAGAAQEESIVKIIVTRGSGERGYQPPRDPHPMRVVMASPPAQQAADLARSGVRVRLCRTRVAIQPRLAGIKHLNRLENVLARAEWSDPGVAEGLMLDTNGNVIGGTMSNLFIADAGGLATPDLSGCGVAGVTRERILGAAARDGVSCRIEALRLDRVLAARELILVNSVIGAWPVRAIEERSLTPGPEAERIQAWLAQDDD
jgi:4-amino-4-deoxychorismate lyase